MHILNEKLRFALTVPKSTVHLRYSFSNRTIFQESLSTGYINNKTAPEQVELSK